MLGSTNASNSSPGAIILRTLGAVIARYPASASIPFERARILDALGDTDGALADYRRTIALDSRHVRAHNDLGLLYARTGRLVDALHCFLAAVDADDTNAAAHANLGAMLLAGDDLAGARRHFERALTLRPDLAGARAGLVTVCERLGLELPAAAREAPVPPSEPHPGADPFFDYVFEIATGAVIAREYDAAGAFLDAIAGDDPRFAPLQARVADVAGSLRAFAFARERFERALALDASRLDVHIGRAIVLEEMGDDAAARAAWERAPLRGAMREIPSTAGDGAVRVLTIASALHAMRFELFTDPAQMANTVLYTQGYVPELPLPPHDVVLVAVADVESDAPALAIAGEIVSRTMAPVINDPGRVRLTGRVAQAARLSGIDGVVVPRIERASRTAMMRAGVPSYLRELGWAYPLLLRSPGFHNGRFFEMLRDDADATSTTAAMPNDELLLVAYADTRAADGLVRKYRVMTIDGRLYPVHLAVSANWKIHYVSSAMAERPDLRAEEAAFLDDMRAVLGDDAIRALEAIASAMELDYAGIDFGIAADGRVVLYEANAAMAIFLPDGDSRWDYRRAAMTAALRAATDMIVRRGLDARLGGRLHEGANH